MLRHVGSTVKRREQLAEILAEGVGSSEAPIPASHAALLDERAALIDAGREELIPGDEAHARLMAVAQANLVNGPERASVSGTARKRRSRTRKSR